MRSCATDTPAASGTGGTAANLPLDFTYTSYAVGATPGGAEAKFSDILAGGKPVVLNMWAGLCPSCRVEMPDFQDVYDESVDEIVLFGLDIGPFVGLGDQADAIKLLEDLDVTFPTGSTEQQEVIAAYRVLAMPSTYFITPDGTVVESWAGPLSGARLRELVDALVAAS